MLPLLSSRTQAQFVGVLEGEGTSGFGSALVSCKTNVDDVSVLAGSAPQTSVLELPGIAKQGSLIALPTLQRHASARYGAATELAKHEPFMTGAEASSDVGLYGIT
jgi:hypothetical protein